MAAPPLIPQWLPAERLAYPVSSNSLATHEQPQQPLLVAPKSDDKLGRLSGYISRRQVFFFFN